MKSMLIICVFVCAAAGQSAAPQEAGAAEAAKADTLGTGHRSTESKEQLKQQMAVIGSAEVPGQSEWQRTKNAKVAVVSSMLLPGLGQVYNGRKFKAAITVGFFYWFAANAWLETKEADRALARRDAHEPGSVEWKFQNSLYEFHKDYATDFVWWTGLVWLLAALDSFIDAHLYDVRSVDPNIMTAPSNQKYIGMSVKF